MTDARPSLLAAIRSIFNDTRPSSEPLYAAITEDLEEILTVTAAMASPQAGAPDPTSRAALAHLPPPGEGQLGEICSLTHDAAPLMPWHYSYGSGDGLAERITFADLVGPSGPYVTNRLRLGLTLVGAQTHYKMHAHPARELYFIVSGRAAWTASATTQWPGPGAFVLHPPNIPHAMQTAKEPLLAIYAWRGDIFTPPFYT